MTRWHVEFDIEATATEEVNGVEHQVSIPESEREKFTEAVALDIQSMPEGLEVDYDYTIIVHSVDCNEVK